jgi:hypothetical protein
MTKLECLLCALWEYNKARLPTDPAFNANNPLRLGKYSNGVATGELKRFASLHSGICAGLFDLGVKVSGKSRAKLDGENYTIKGLIRVYSLKDGTEQYVCRWLRRAIGDDSIKPETKLNYFIDARPTDTNRS